MCVALEACRARGFEFLLKTSSSMSPPVQRPANQSHQTGFLRDTGTQDFVFGSIYQVPFWYMGMGQNQTTRDRRFWSMFPLARVPFWVPFFLTQSHIVFEPQLTPGGLTGVRFSMSPARRCLARRRCQFWRNRRPKKLRRPTNRASAPALGLLRRWSFYLGVAQNETGGANRRFWSMFPLTRATHFGMEKTQKKAKQSKNISAPFWNSGFLSHSHLLAWLQLGLGHVSDDQSTGNCSSQWVPAPPSEFSKLFWVDDFNTRCVSGHAKRGLGLERGSV